MPQSTRTQTRAPRNAATAQVEDQLNAAPTKTTALARIEALPARTLEHYGKHGYNQMRLVMIWTQVARDLNLPEFLYFMERCVVTGLDPLRKQIYAIKRRDAKSPTGFTVAHQVGIDGFRAIAASSGLYAGSDPPEFSEPIKVPGGKDGHEICRVTVYKIVQGQRVPFTGECRWTDFYPGENQGGMWRQSPHNQLAKCTEAQALRKGFPVELGEFEMVGEPGSSDLQAQFADSVMSTGRALEPEYIEVTDRRTGEMTTVRAADEYERLHAAELADEEGRDRATVEGDAAAQAAADAPVVDTTATEVQADDDPPPWEQPAESPPQASARREWAAREGLCTDPECLEREKPNPAAKDTDPPRCLAHVGA